MAVPNKCRDKLHMSMIKPSPEHSGDKQIRRFLSFQTKKPDMIGIKKPCE